MAQRPHYKEMYTDAMKELYALKISLHPEWHGDPNTYVLSSLYSLSELRLIWYDLVEKEYANAEDMSLYF